ncbi:hypothetical protein KDI_41180 [Dictyobacter arantiisoli]|uniref:Uncharacterized protein n=1 Tax=Dictyobacter arantiisoli TaxID=2014874 RepID=A0A5A5THW0_9CHLR|nr:hypothetical protein KDI_41180 [Dictyobacter arantiisoli]
MKTGPRVIWLYNLAIDIEPDQETGYGFIVTLGLEPHRKSRRFETAEEVTEAIKKLLDAFN